MHTRAHPLAGRTLLTTASVGPHPPGAPFRIVDWWDRASGSGWRTSHSPAALAYRVRVALHGLPADDEVLYGKIADLGYLAHVTEIATHDARPAH